LHEQARKIITELLGAQVRFEGHFNRVFDNLKKGRQDQLLDWVRDCQDGKNLPISSSKVQGLIAFILKFRESNLRSILTKKKNEYFIAIFLDKHKYYNQEREKLGI